VAPIVIFMPQPSIVHAGQGKYIEVLFEEGTKRTRFFEPSEQLKITARRNRVSFMVLKMAAS
jgi:hypothetical protein